MNLMKAWELLKLLQERKKLRHRSYEKGHWIALTTDMYGDFGIVDNQGGGHSILDYLNADDEDGWEVYKEE